MDSATKVMSRTFPQQMLLIVYRQQNTINITKKHNKPNK